MYGESLSVLFMGQWSLGGSKKNATSGCQQQPHLCSESEANPHLCSQGVLLPSCTERHHWSNFHYSLLYYYVLPSSLGHFRHSVKAPQYLRIKKKSSLFPTSPLNHSIITEQTLNVFYNSLSLLPHALFFRTCPDGAKSPTFHQHGANQSH